MKDKAKVIYQASTETIRQMPENYLIAYREKGYWICDPDIAANQKIATIVFQSLFTFEMRWAKDAQLIADFANTSYKNEEAEEAEEFFVVTLMNDYQLENQFIFKDEKKAQEKSVELQKKSFEDVFNELMSEGTEEQLEEFDENSTFLDYQDSSAWWDNDTRVKVHLEHVIL